MSDTSRLRPTTTATDSAAPAAAVLQALTPHLREWLPRQRWFAGKGRPISGLGLVSAVELLPVDGRLGTPGLLHLLLDVAQPQTAPECYQLLVGTRELLPPALAPALIGRTSGGPLEGLTAYEALHDPKLAALLLERLGTGGRTGSLRFTTEPGAAIPSGLPSRLSTAEQSNSSVVYGDTFILKFFRRVSPGLNPDLELSLALARDGSRRIAPPVAWFEALGLHDEPATLAVLQRYLPGSRDGWELALDAAGSSARGADGDIRAEAAELGRATAEVHAALARTLPTTTLRGPEVRLLATAMTDRLDRATHAVPALTAYAPALRQAYADLAALAERGAPPAAQRIHGDLHLGQALHAEGRGWVLIDFEGEPSRPLSERRRPQSRLQDVAGMLRSFDYAARHRDPAWPGAAQWAGRHRAAFCSGYAAVLGHDPRDLPVLLRAYETDKAVYEVVYEARHRPDWLPIPMAAIRRLSGADPGEPV